MAVLSIKVPSQSNTIKSKFFLAILPDNTLPAPVIGFGLPIEKIGNPIGKY
ncbi:hypothetical protein CFter6_3628 [Collimonas fungivorans]|uniref:Uncharacterized protein n=1 Tax=Collimonas fungivorans TaxID=158899 RepID=A0A127PEW8_9BURK|nr:hypothetical protein CFter6_3628 [Collimonas fungivorans]